MKRDASFERFVATLHQRLEAGERAYGDASFRRAPAALSGEIEEELLDVCGWAFVLWVRLRDLRGRLPTGRGRRRPRRRQRGDGRRR